MDNYISGLKKSIKTKNMDKAKEFIGQIASKNENQKLEVLQILALTPDKEAFELLSFLTQMSFQDPQLQDRIVQLVTDRAHLNFNFAMILLENTDTPTIIQIVPLLKHILTKETSTELLNKIIKTAGNIKIEKMVDDVAEFIFYDNIDLKAQAVRALERIGTPLAIRRMILMVKS